MPFADVILPLALPRNYTYAVPPELEVQPGSRVAVQFGKNKKYAAVVKRLHEEAPAEYTPKPLLYLLDEEPVINPVQLAFWEWMSRYYMCSEGEVLNAALPAYLKLSSETVFLFNELYGDDFSGLDDEEYLVAEALHIRRELKLDEIQQVLGRAQVYPVMKRLLEKQVCYIYEELKEAYRPKTEKIVMLRPEYADEAALAPLFDQLQRAPRQMELLLAYIHLRHTSGVVRQRELLEKAGASSAQLKGLVEKGVLEIQQQPVDRLPLNAGPEIKLDLTLNDEQEDCLQQIHDHFRKKSVVLLHGVTSSGKTMVYIRLIEQWLRQHKQVLYLLPEIALTAQIVRRLQQHFGNRIAIYHSRFNNNERVEIWKKVKSGETRIVLGARSALLLPFKELGLLILDEEHDPSFKQQDPAPRYHARDAAIYYATLFKARVLLGSATPSVESYYHARRGKYGLVTLRERYGGAAMPSIEISDTRKAAFHHQSSGHFTAQLREAIEQTLAADKQVILFQNRRGYAPFMICTTCGFVPRCRNCDVSLTYHKHHDKLHCHYCGQQYPRPDACPACGSPTLVTRSFGTEKVEDDLVALFPHARVARMDLDSVRSREGHHKLIRLFEERRIDILVGTQMVVKGLDFDHVNLVGILHADSLLSYPDFRVHERAFQLMEQVSGRAGRKDTPGRVIIQAANTQHPVLGYVVRHDYEAFFDVEIAERERFGYPPFSRLLRITLKHKKQEVVRQAAAVLAEGLPAELQYYRVGPAVPPVGRIRGYYLMEMLIKLPRTLQRMESYKQVLRAQFIRMQSLPPYKSLQIVPDVDCM
ncbi:replication restart helicase PriA [Compostibacter hankyongensis]|uniref:Replication restart protein PriA n=1 Tax=Compostibacter hankyongensis TaxID=1007089 RepID=A0ABP8G8H0_9BACT